MQFQCDLTISSAHLGNVDQTVFVDTQIHEGTECSNIGNNSRNLHSDLQVLYRMYVVCK